MIGTGGPAGTPAFPSELLDAADFFLAGPFAAVGFVVAELLDEAGCVAVELFPVFALPLGPAAAPLVASVAVLLAVLG
jgi:hypothetical protein